MFSIHDSSENIFNVYSEVNIVQLTTFKQAEHERDILCSLMTSCMQPAFYCSLVPERNLVIEFIVVHHQIIFIHICHEDYFFFIFLPCDAPNIKSPQKECLPFHSQDRKMRLFDLHQNKYVGKELVDATLGSPHNEQKHVVLG